ncbi:hypothetical protein [Streptomyces sp. NPDC052042]|uniref:hypothetical protein n=1 Tax=Streptomyces sp. NPDC052042 TaxID=3365683 RepID=UPI0037CDF88E
MTSTDTSRHPDVSEISDLMEGLLSSAHAVEVSDHVEGCELCGDVHASLIEIRELLGAVPAPQRMPDDVADRIDAALAAAALDATTTDHAAIHVSRETPPATVTRPDMSLPTTDRPAGHPGAATGPGRRRTRRRRRVAVLGAALSAAVIGLGFLLWPNDRTAQEATALDTANREADSTASGTSTFSESTLESDVRTLLRRADRKPTVPDNGGAERKPPSVRSQSTPGNTSSVSEAPQTPLRTPAASVPNCVQQGIGRDTPALAAEAGTFEGTSAFLVVLPHPSDSARVQAYIVDAACTRDKDTAMGKLLLTHAYARP